MNEHNPEGICDEVQDQEEKVKVILDTPLNLRAGPRFRARVA